MDSCTFIGYKMGCWTSKNESTNGADENESVSPLTGNEPGASIGKEYSWSNRDRADMSRFIIENVHGGNAIRRQHEIAGQGIVIQNCSHAVIVLLDHSSTVLIDDCIDCTIFISPVSGSIALRNCKSCRIMSASQQFRTRDCNKLDCFIYSSTQPVIESSQHLRFASFSADFQDLDQLFLLTNLDPFYNKWNQVYDFCSVTNQEYEKHYTIISENYDIEHLFQPLVATLKNEQINFSLKSTVVPFTVGMQQPQIDTEDGDMEKVIVYDLFLLFVAFRDLLSDHVRQFQEILAKSHQLPHENSIPLLSRSFDANSKWFKQLKKLFFDGLETQKIVAILYRNRNHEINLLDDHFELLPAEIRHNTLETIQFKTFCCKNGKKEFIEFLDKFHYK